ncbi:LysR family transcriptional regulator [Massilia sp. KIM]|uniref:LysR family transcriptional regulator n=1 Tax=Massilia sp. KIM TaxID=1955422 RepID=UPI00098EA53D|nr:LysR family transcriptional regulator [Massilia sp. KIM]OON62504.1 LysR family transcriptional regulator [Massilia sp. KIM]
MGIDELQTFVEVADAGGITPAAFRLGVSKSIVSRRLARLEDDLKTQLLLRTTRGAALTEAGVAFRDYAARACAEIELARETIKPVGELTGRLRLSAPLAFGATHFAPILAEMSRRHPRLHIQACYSDSVIDLIADGFDCAIRLGFLPDSNLVARLITPLYSVLVASPDYIKKHGEPKIPDDLSAHEALTRNTESWQFKDGTTVVTVHPQGRFKADNNLALVNAALTGIGVACLPTGLVQEHLDSGALVPIMRRYPAPSSGVYVVRPPGQHTTNKVRLLIDLLIEHFRTTPLCLAPPPESAAITVV